MSSQNTSPQTATSTEDDVESTQSMAPVNGSAGSARADESASSPERPEPAPQEKAQQASAPQEKAQSAAGTSDAATGPAEDAAAEQSSSPVKDGAVKAAAAALAAARSAARKVQSASSAASASGQPVDPATGSTQSAGSSSATGGGTPPPPPAPDATDRSAPRPEMHYSVGGVHGAAQPETGAQPVAATEAGVRRVRLSVSRVDPWSVMKLAFLLSFAVGIMMVVATAVAWYMLNSMGTFGTIQEFLVETLGNQAIDITQFVAFERVISLSMLVALVNMVLMTALATIMAILYNITAALVGGVHVALTDE